MLLELHFHEGFMWSIFKIISQNKYILTIRWNRFLLRRYIYLSYSRICKIEPFPRYCVISEAAWRNHCVQRRSWGSGSQSTGDPRWEPREQPNGLPGHPADVQIPGPSPPGAGEWATPAHHRPANFPSQMFFLSLTSSEDNTCLSRKALAQVFHHCSIVFLLSKEQIKFLEEEIQSLEESELSLSSYSDWYSSTHKNFNNVAAKIDKVDKVTMGKKMKTLEVGMQVSGLSPSPSFTSCSCLPRRIGSVFAPAQYDWWSVAHHFTLNSKL